MLNVWVESLPQKSNDFTSVAARNIFEIDAQSTLPSIEDDISPDHSPAHFCDVRQINFFREEKANLSKFAFRYVETVSDVISNERDSEKRGA